MTEVQESPPGVHPVALLLPWYLSGQLNETERAEVQQHLQGCAACGSELASLTALRTQSRQMFMEAPSPSPRLRQAVLGRLRQRTSRPTAAERLAQLFQGLLAPKWAPTAAMAVIVAQLGAVAWLATRPHEMSPPIIARDVPTEAIRLKILFNPAAALGEVQAAIHDLGGRIVDGPAADGAYTLELAPDSPQRIAERLRALRERKGLIERIDDAAP